MIPPGFVEAKTCDHPPDVRLTPRGRKLALRGPVQPVRVPCRRSMRFNEHIEGDGPTVFAHACKMGLKGIVSKRKNSAYRSGRSRDWLKMKNPQVRHQRQAQPSRASQKRHRRPITCRSDIRA
jgi:hypothetical protein